jgi:hypothetical protein
MRPACISTKNSASPLSSKVNFTLLWGRGRLAGGAKEVGFHPGAVLRDDEIRKGSPGQCLALAFADFGKTAVGVGDPAVAQHHDALVQGVEQLDVFRVHRVHGSFLAGIPRPVISG